MFSQIAGMSSELRLKKLRGSGGYVMAKALGDPGIFVAQLELYKRHLELLFGPR